MWDRMKKKKRSGKLNQPTIKGVVWEMIAVDDDVDDFPLH